MVTVPTPQGLSALRALVDASDASCAKADADSDEVCVRSRALHDVLSALAAPTEGMKVVRALVIGAFGECVHFAGEAPYDEERGAEIGAHLGEDCARASAAAAGLWAVAPGDPWAAAVLIDDVSFAPDTRENLCRAAQAMTDGLGPDADFWASIAREQSGARCAR